MTRPATCTSRTPATIGCAGWTLRGTITTVAGTGSRGYSGDGGSATSAKLDSPTGVAVDASGNLYIADAGNDRVRRVDPAGQITTVAGTGSRGYSGDGGPAPSAELHRPIGLALDASGNLYIADAGNHRVRRVDSAGQITTVAGTGSYDSPSGLAVDAFDNLYIADTGNHRVRRVDPAGQITTVAGTGSRGRSAWWTTRFSDAVWGHRDDGGSATNASLGHPVGLAVDAFGNLYIAQTNGIVRRAEQVADGGQGLVPDDHGNHRASATPLSLNSSLAGMIETSGDQDWFRTEFNAKTDVAIYTTGSPLGTTGTLLVSENQEVAQGIGGKAGNFRIEATVDAGVYYVRVGAYSDSMGSYTLHLRTWVKPQSGTITTVAGTDEEWASSGDGGLATIADIGDIGGLAVDAIGNLYIAEPDTDRVRRVDPGGTITTVAGTTSGGYSGDGGSATSAKLDSPTGVAVDASGNLYIADSRNHRVRRVDPAGQITTVAGTGSGGYSGDGGSATSAKLDSPTGVAVDASGNLYIADAGNHRVRRVDPAGQITTVAGTGSRGYSGDGGSAPSAELDWPIGLALDASGNLYIADAGNHRVRRVDPAGQITTVAGTGSRGYSGDGGSAPSAELDWPIGLALDASGNLYIADFSTHRVRRVDPGGTITTVAGTGSRGYSGDGGPALGAQLDEPIGLALDASGNLYIADLGNHRVRRVELAGLTGGGLVLPNPADDHGNHQDSATPVPLDSSLAGVIESVGDEDWFRLEFTAETDVAIYTTGSVGTTGTLFDSENQEVAKDIDGDAKNFRIEATVEAGVYYVRVESYGEGTGDYTLHVKRRAASTNAYGMEFELVPAGQFAMGSTSGEADSDEQPVSQVEISQAFYMGKHEVTQAQWKAVMGEVSNPSESRLCDECPVEWVTWNDALEFVRRLNEALETTVYRLPTEAEWEYAARAGEAGERYAPLGELDEIAWHDGNSGGTTRPIGEKRANAFGLHDMLGNVWEWVQDWHGPYPGVAATDPTGALTGRERVSRGGSWFSQPRSLRSAERQSSIPGHNTGDLGLRLAMTVPSDPGPPATGDDHADQPNNDATQISCSFAGTDSGCSVSGTIDTGRDSDVFRLVLAEPTDVLIYTTGSLQTWGTLWREGSQALEVVASAQGRGGSGNFRIRASLEPGTYFVRVRILANPAGDYTLHAQRQRLDVTDAIGMEFVRVPAGSFRRERPATEVEISQAFYMGKHEVTQGQWEAVMGTDPSSRKGCDECPVDSVTWEQVQEFIARLNQIEDGKRTYRLPTEAEWEYAARAGAAEERHADDLAQVAWFLKNGGGETQPVGGRLANAFGLHDMQGNVSEWVEDWAGGKYPGSAAPVRNPIGPRTGQDRVVRGCSTFDESHSCRSTRSFALAPDASLPGIGFRLVSDGPEPEYFLDDHPNTADGPLAVSRYDMPSEGTFELQGDFASGGDVDYFRLRVFEPTSVTVSVKYDPSEEPAEVRVGSYEGLGTGGRESCSFDADFSKGTVKLDLGPRGEYCVIAKSNAGNGGAYKLVVEPSREEAVDPEKTSYGKIVVRYDVETIDLTAGAEQLEFESETVIESGSGVRNFRLPSVDEKTRVAIFASSGYQTEMDVQGKVARDSYLYNRENYPVVVDLERGGDRYLRVKNSNGYTLSVEEVRPVREERVFMNSLGMEFAKLPDSNVLKENLGFDFKLGSEEFWAPGFEGEFSAEIYPKPVSRHIDSFWIGKHEVTQCEWAALMVHPAVDTADPESYLEFCQTEEGQKPMVNVTFRDVKAFVDEINRRLGPGYRLVKEAEWEYAAQAGESGELYDGPLDKIAWHLRNSTRQGWSGKWEPKPEDLKVVETRGPNAFGLHDMLGNAWEWVDDKYEREPAIVRAFRKVIHSEWTWFVLGLAATATSAGAGTTAAIALAGLLTTIVDANEAMVVRGGGYTSEEIGSSVRNRGVVSPHAPAAPNGGVLLAKAEGTLINAVLHGEIERVAKFRRNVKKWGLGLANWVGSEARVSTYAGNAKPGPVGVALMVVDLFGWSPGLDKADSSPSLGFRVAFDNDQPPGHYLEYPDWVDPEDDHSDTRYDDSSEPNGGPTPIGLGESIRGVIGTGDDVDVFELKLEEDTTVAVYTTGTLDTVGKVVTGQGLEVAENDDSPDAQGGNFWIEKELKANDPSTYAYYVEVGSHGRATGSYTLHVDRHTGPSLTNSIGMKFARIPAGRFEMGQTSIEPFSDERPVTEVEISQPFYLGKHEVTQGQWRKVMGSIPESPSRDCRDCPVEYVSWNAVQDFIGKLNAMEGVNAYRLPTEAEWEFAARAGTTEESYENSRIFDNYLGLFAWYEGNSRVSGRSGSGGRSRPVGGKRPNAYGLYDMLGNAMEWVQDWYGLYPGGSVTDPVGPATGPSRVMRGCGWYSSFSECRAAKRFRSALDPKYPGFGGLRLVRTEAAGGTGLPPPPAADDHSDDLAGATPVSLGESLAGRFETSADADYFRLQVGERTELAIFTTGSLATKGTLLDGGKSEVAADSRAGGNLRIETTVEAGAYYVKVEPGDGWGSYTLHVARRSDFSNSVGMEFALIPAGEFDMGSMSAEADSDEQPVTRVRISQPFYLGKHEVTQGQWEAVMGSNPSWFANCGADCPVEQVSWSDVREFVRKLNALEGGSTYRLPTEAEWEYAARGATTGESHSDGLGLVARCSDNSRGSPNSPLVDGRGPHPVGGMEPNAYGLHDMLGNVWEWVQDRYGRHPGGEVTDPVGPATGANRVMRGGGWASYARQCRAAARLGDPGYRLSALGFRLAKTVDAVGQPPEPGGDDHGDDRRSATDMRDMSLGQSVEGRIETGADIDYFSFSPEVKTDVAIFTTGTLATKGTLWERKPGPDQSPRVVATDSGAGTNFRIEATVERGTYYVKVEALGDGTGGYTLHLDAGGQLPLSGADDHSDNLSSATRVILGQPLPGRIESAADADYFRLQVEGKTDVAIFTTGLLATQWTLLDGIAREVDTDSGVGTNFRSEATIYAGTYYVKVEALGSGTGSYMLHVEPREGVGTTQPTLENSIGMEFVSVPAGEFDMGSTGDEAYPREQPVTRVRISEPFYLGKHEVTRRQWEEVMKTEPWSFKSCGDNCPVEGVSWEDAQEFVQKLNEMEGTTLYRLPTEAQWEWAARGGTTGERYSDYLGAIAWYGNTNRWGPRLVGLKAPNEYGLHDMLGNVSEWVQDRYRAYPGGAVTDPEGPRAGSDRVRRGCNWASDARDCRVAYRSFFLPSADENTIGFRLAMKADAGGAVPPSLRAVDDHGNDRVNPTQLKLGQSQAGRIETADDVDFFVFSVDRQTTVAVYTTGTLDTEGRVLNFLDDREVASNRNSGAGRNFRIEETLNAGVYLVEVWSNRGATGAYELHLEAIVASGQ